MAYQLASEGVRAVMRKNIQLDEVITIFEVPGNTGFPAASDNGDLIFFHTDATAGGDLEVVRWSAATESAENISDNGDFQDLDPQVARDGETLCWRATAHRRNTS